MSFQEKLQVLRKEKGLSQESLSESIGVSRQAVAKWESGQSYPDIDKLITLSDLFKVSIDKLVKDIDENCSLHHEESKDHDINADIIDFLCRAKKSTYAGRGTETSSSRPHSHDFQYSEGNLQYIDTYIGVKKFAGEEALWLDNLPLWSMNYVGRVISEGFSASFLKEALLLVPKKHPFRGPKVYQNGEYKYHCIVTGDFDWFNGYEEVFYNDKKVYECIFHGGSIN